MPFPANAAHPIPPIDTITFQLREDKAPSPVSVLDPEGQLCSPPIIASHSESSLRLCAKRVFSGPHPHPDLVKRALLVFLATHPHLEMVSCIYNQTGVGLSTEDTKLKYGAQLWFARSANQEFREVENIQSSKEYTFVSCLHAWVTIRSTTGRCGEDLISCSKTKDTFGTTRYLLNEDICKDALRELDIQEQMADIG